MRKTNKIAIATVVIQTKQHLAAVVAQDRMVMLNTLRYPNEIRSPKEFNLPTAGLRGAGINEKEMKMAIALIDNMTERWKQDKYHDSYREDIMARIRAKIKAGQTEEVAETEKEAPPRHRAEVIDLVALLKNSVRQKSGRDKPEHANNRSVVPTPFGKHKSLVRRKDAKPWSIVNAHEPR